MKPTKIVVVGSVNMDCTVYVPELPRPGETILGGRLEFSIGGKGANQAIAARRMGSEVALVAGVGNDSYADQCIRFFIEEGIDTRYVTQVADVATGFGSILVDSVGENMIAVASGANARLCPEDVDRASVAFEGAHVLLLQHEVSDEANVSAAKRAARAGAKVLLNAAPAKPISAELQPLVDVLVLNEAEARVLSSTEVLDLETAEIALRRLLAQYPCVLLTLGASGAIVGTNQVVKRIAAFAVQAVDSVGAGDTFCGAFASAWGSGMEIEDAARVASAAGAMAVTRRGAVPSIPTHADVEALLAARIGS